MNRGATRQTGFMNSIIWSLAGPIRRNVFLSIILGLLVTAAYIGQGALLALALAAVRGAHDYGRAGACVGGLGVLVIIRGMLLFQSEIAAQKTAQVAKESLRERLLTKLLELGPSYANAHQSGKLQETLVDGVEALETYFSRYIPTVFVAWFGCCGVLFCLALVDLSSALVLAPFVALAPAFSRLWTRWQRPRSSGLFGARMEFAAYLLDSLQGLMTLKAFAATGRRRVELVQHAVNLREQAMRTLSVSLIRGGVTGLLSLGGAAVLLSWNAWRVSAGELPPFALFMALFLTREAFRPLDRMEKEFHAAWNGVTAAPSIARLLAAEVAVRETPSPVPVPSRADVVFDGVTFSYEGAERAALSAVSFSIDEHERVALVGPSGSGKTTIAALLLRFFDPGHGAIRIGGVDLRDLSLADLRSQIALVAQDTYLFHGTIADNLRIARPEATQAEIEAAATAAHIDDFIRSLPNRYETDIGERGAQFSGGQRQRLAIARALLKNAPILILDEATSNVDPTGEEAIQKALDHLTAKRTTIVIAHRLSTIRNADRILVLNNGSIVECGTHDELVRRDGLYSKLTLAQETAA